MEIFGTSKGLENAPCGAGFSTGDFDKWNDEEIEEVACVYYGWQNEYEPDEFV